MHSKQVRKTRYAGFFYKSVFSDLRGVVLLLGGLYSGNAVNKIHETQAKKSVVGTGIVVSHKRH